MRRQKNKRDETLTACLIPVRVLCVCISRALRYHDRYCQSRGKGVSLLLVTADSIIVPIFSTTLAFLEIDMYLRMIYRRGF